MCPARVIASGAGTDHLDAGRRRHRRRRHPRLRGAMRGDRKARRPHHPDGEPRARQAARIARRLRQGLWPHPRPGEGAGDHPLARRDVRSRARRLLGPRATTRRRWTSPSTSSPTNAAKVDGVKISLLDKDKEIAMRRRLPQGVRMYTGDDFNYAELIAGDARGLFRRAARHFRRDRAGGRGGARRARRAATPRPSTTSSRRPCRCRATSSRRRRASTRPASCSWPISTASRIISRMVGGQESARSTLHLAELFRLADAAGLLPIPSAPPRACATCWRRAASTPDARPFAAITPWLVDQHRDGEAVDAASSSIEGCARAGIPRISPWRDMRAGLRRRARRASSSARTA